MSDAIASYWRFALPPSRQQAPTIHTVPPDGAVSLCWLPGGKAAVVGPRMRALRVPVYPGAEYLGVRFHPGAAGPLLGLDVRSLRDTLMPFERADFAATMRSSGLAGLDALIREWRRRAAWERPDAVVTELTRRIVRSDGAIPVAALMDGLNLSYRQILRRFYEAAGLTPKEFARLRRIRAACRESLRSAEPGWATVSAGAGFAGQSHLAREFQDIYGWPPRLVHEYLRRIGHQALARRP